MALTFEYVKDLETGAQPFICHEKDSTIYNYYIRDELALDKMVVAPLGTYDSITFKNEDRHLTTRAASRIGVKNFPGIGGIGFYRDAYSDDCHIVAPIHIKPELIGVPTLTLVEIVSNQLHIVITPSEAADYTCYRVVVRQGAFAFEYITYKTECYVDAPTVNGDYTCYCFGYDEDTGAISSNSNDLKLTVTEGSDAWSPIDSSDFAARIAALEREMGNVGLVLDEINGVEV